MKSKIVLRIEDAKNIKDHFSVTIKESLKKEPIFFLRPTSIFVILGERHSFKSIIVLLLKARVINEKYQWTFEQGHIVIFGSADLSSECLWLIYSLEEKAQKKGGYIHYLTNSDHLNKQYEWTNRHPKYLVRKNSQASENTILYDGNNELFRWLQTKNSLVRMNDLIFANENQPNTTTTQVGKVIGLDYIRPKGAVMIHGGKPQKISRKHLPL